MTGAELRAAYAAGQRVFIGAVLRRADLYFADLDGAVLHRADLRGSILQWAGLSQADLTGSDLRGADLTGADLRGAVLTGAVMPDGRTYEAWVADPLEGICDEPEARSRAIAAWPNRTWEDCPMNAALGIQGVEKAPEGKRLKVATFVALLDGGHLPHPPEEVTP